jgi:imidazolonepropionase-like amidohydrolase
MATRGININCRLLLPAVAFLTAMLPLCLHAAPPVNSAAADESKRMDTIRSLRLDSIPGAMPTYYSPHSEARAKVFANGRAGVPNSDPMSRDLNDDELIAAVQEATAHGIPAAAHAFTDDAVSAAVKAGVRTIEHGSLITSPTLELMRTRGVCFTPTLSPLYIVAKVNPDASAEEKALASRAQMMLDHAHKAVAIARRLGVTIIAGADTDYDSGSHTVIDEIVHLAEAGFSPSEALDAATVHSAACLKIDKQKGSIQPGFDADLVVYASDPTADLQVLRSPLMVVTRGHVFVDKLSN